MNRPAPGRAALTGGRHEQVHRCFLHRLEGRVDDELAVQALKLWRQGDFKKGIPACAGCHGPSGAGLPNQYPRLAGQFPEYTEAQLKTFRSEERNNDPEQMMRMIAAKLSDPEIKAVSEYAAGLR